SAVPCRLFLVVVENKVDQFHRAYRGYCVFIYQLLPSVGIQYDGEVVKALYRALQLETVRKVDGHRKMFFSYLVQKYILQIDIWFVHLTILLDHISLLPDYPRSKDHFNSTRLFQTFQYNDG